MLNLSPPEPRSCTLPPPPPGVRVSLKEVAKLNSMLNGYDVIIFNSLLHDVSNFRDQVLP